MHHACRASSGAVKRKSWLLCCAYSLNIRQRAPCASLTRTRVHTRTAGFAGIKIDVVTHHLSVPSKWLCAVCHTPEVRNCAAWRTMRRLSLFLRQRARFLCPLVRVECAPTLVRGGIGGAGRVDVHLVRPFRVWSLCESSRTGTLPSVHATALRWARDAQWCAHGCKCCGARLNQHARQAACT